MYQSETSKYRRLFTEYCKGNGMDLGYGGDPVVPFAITQDLPNQYADTGKHPCNLRGDARHLNWFKDGALDWIYSSHLLEDFENTEEVLREWLRVLRPGGFLLILIPDEMVYRAHCRKSGQEYNGAHKIKDMGLKYVLNILDRLGVKILKAYDTTDLGNDDTCYNVAIIAKKLSPEAPAQRPYEEREAADKNMSKAIEKERTASGKKAKEFEFNIKTGKEVYDAFREIIASGCKDYSLKNLKVSVLDSAIRDFGILVYLARTVTLADETTAKILMDWGITRGKPQGLEDAEPDSPIVDFQGALLPFFLEKEERKKRDVGSKLR